MTNLETTCVAVYIHIVQNNLFISVHVFTAECAEVPLTDFPTTKCFAFHTCTALYIKLNAGIVNINESYLSGDVYTVVDEFDVMEGDVYTVVDDFDVILSER